MKKYIIGVLLLFTLLFPLVSAVTDISDTRINTTGDIFSQEINITSFAYNQTLPAITEILSYAYYNLTDFDISDYVTHTYLTSAHYNKTEIVAINTSMKNYADSTFSPISEPLSLHLNQDNFFHDEYIIYDEGNNNFTFNQSKLATIYYNASAIQVATGTGAGTIAGIQIYNGLTYNVTEATGTPGMDFRINFTSVTDFNQIIFRYKSSIEETQSMNLQIWDYTSSSWVNYATLGISEDFVFESIAVLDSTDHLSGGIVQVRFYSSEAGNTNHKHQFDLVQITDGFATPSGSEIDPIWTSQKINYSTTSTILGWNYYNSTDFSISDYATLSYLTSAHYNKTEIESILANGTFIPDLSSYATTTYVDTQNTSIKNYVDGTFQPIGSYLVANDLLPYVQWTDIWSQVYNETEVNAINTSMKNYVDSTFLTSYTETDPVFNNNIGNIAFENQSNVFTANQTMNGNLKIGEYLNYTVEGVTRYYSNGCYSIANSTGLFEIC